MIPSTFETLSSDVGELLHDQSTQTRCLSTSLMLRDTANSMEGIVEPYRTFTALGVLLHRTGLLSDFLREIEQSPAVGEAMRREGLIS